MSLLRHQSEGDQPERPQDFVPYLPRKSSRSAASCVGHGALACPACDLPLVVAAAVGVTTALRCPFCREVNPARRYLRLGGADTALNAVQITARLPG